MINFLCQHCGNTLSVTEKYAGRDACCRMCRKFIIVPEANGLETDVFSLSDREHYLRMEALLAHLGKQVSAYKKELMPYRDQQGRLIPPTAFATADRGKWDPEALLHLLRLLHARQLKNLASTHDALAARTKEHAEERAKAAARDSAYAELKTAADAQQTALEESRATTETQQVALATLQVELAQAQDDLDAAALDTEELWDSIMRLQEGLDESEQEAQQLRQQLAEAGQEKQDLLEQQETAESDLLSLTQQKEEAEATALQLKQQLEEAENTTEALRDQQAQSQAALEALEQAHAELKEAQKTAAESTAEDVRVQHTQSQEALEALTEKHDALKVQHEDALTQMLVVQETAATDQNETQQSYEQLQSQVTSLESLLGSFSEDASLQEILDTWRSRMEALRMDIDTSEASEAFSDLLQRLDAFAAALLAALDQHRPDELPLSDVPPTADNAELMVISDLLKDTSLPKGDIMAQAYLHFLASSGQDGSPPNES